MRPASHHNPTTVTTQSFCFAEADTPVGTPDDALSYFRKFNMSRQLARRVYSRLAGRYFVRSQRRAALKVYRHLVEITDDQEVKA